MTRQLLTSNEVAERLQVNRSTLWHWRQKGQLKPVALGTLVRFRLKDIEHIEEHGLPEPSTTKQPETANDTNTAIDLINGEDTPIKCGQSDRQADHPAKPANDPKA